MREYILAIDQGTTGSRAVVYDKKGRTVASAYREFCQYFPRLGWQPVIGKIRMKSESAGE